MSTDPVETILRDIDSLAAGRGTLQLMEVCGTHTVSLFRSGIKTLMPPNLRLLSGPGCPVCVTSQGYIDAALEIAAQPGTIVCTYGDMVRVPGRSGSLERIRAAGGDVRILYSAREAIAIAQRETDKQVVWLAVGFETTAPATAAVILDAERLGLDNFTILSGHKLAIPAMLALLQGGDIPIDGFLCPGHVSVIIGERAYDPIARDHGKPCVIAGFEPRGMAEGIRALLRQVAEGRAAVENVYGAAVKPDGNPAARAALERVFEVADTPWRAIGVLPASGLELRAEFRRFDAGERLGVIQGADYDPPGCRCGEVIQGKVLPTECALFAETCTPADPIGPCMVSSEGTCSAWYKYGRNAARGGR